MNKLLLNADENIARCGVTLVAIAPETKQELASETGAFVYSIGHKFRQRPDFLVFIGPMEGESLSLADIQERGMAAGSLINSMVTKWNEEGVPVRPGELAASGDHILYEVCDASDPQVQQLYGDVKRDMTIQATNYYGNDRYDVLVLRAIGWD